MNWNPNGAITLRRLQGMRLVMVDKETMVYISESMRSQAIADACLELEKQLTRRLAFEYLGGFKAKLSRYGAIKKRVLEAIEGYSLLLGMGRVELEKFTPGEKGSLVLRMPFDADLISAGVCGTLEGIDRCLYSYELSAKGKDSFRLTLKAKEDGEEGYMSMVETNPVTPLAKAGSGMEICGECRLPLQLGKFIWEEVFGTINAGPGGRRVALLPAYMISALSTSCAGPEGPGNAGVVEEAVFATTLRDAKGAKSDAYAAPAVGSMQAENLFETLSMRGWGALLEAQIEGKEWSFSVLNPVDDALLAGWMRSLYTFARGKEPSIEIRAEPGQTTYRLM